MDRFDAMSLCLDVAAAGSLSAAGRKLRLPLATVSRRVADLEAHLGTRLFLRSTRRLDLTDAGRDYIAACRRILDDLADAERAVAGEYSEPRGELTVTAPLVMGRLHVLPLVTEFLKAWPRIDLRLSLADRGLNLIEEHVDLAVRLGPLPDSDLIATRVGTVRHIVCASPDYLARRGTPTTPEDLTNHAAIVFEGLTPGGLWRFHADRHTTNVQTHARLTVNSAEAAIAAATEGMGLTRVLSYQAAEATRLGQLDIVLEAHEPPPWPVHLVQMRQGRVPQKLRVFTDWLAPRLRARLT